MNGSWVKADPASQSEQSLNAALTSLLEAFEDCYAIKANPQYEARVEDRMLSALGTLCIRAAATQSIRLGEKMGSSMVSTVNVAGVLVGTAGRLIRKLPADAKAQVLLRLTEHLVSVSTGGSDDSAENNAEKEGVISALRREVGG